MLAMWWLPSDAVPQQTKYAPWSDELYAFVSEAIKILKFRIIPDLSQIETCETGLSNAYFGWQAAWSAHLPEVRGGHTGNS